MKKKILMFSLFIFAFFIMPKNTLAFSQDDYANRSLPNNFEVAGFHTDGVIASVASFSNYEEAKNFMKNNGADDLAIMTKVNGRTKIVDANVALIDLSVSTALYTDFYSNSNLSGSVYASMATSSTYKGVDAAHEDSSYYYITENNQTIIVWTTKARIAGYSGWIRQEHYEIVPITWVKSNSSYTVTNDSIRHNYVEKIQNYYYGSFGRTIGPKPSMLSAGKYYSYDGHYFYNNIVTMIKDYKNNSHSNAVNKDKEYYNYYLYLSNHTRTTYSSANIDEYIRNNMGIHYDAYGTKAEANSSKLYGKGLFFYHAQEKYGVNAVLSLSLSRNETGEGTSELALYKNNGFGLNAVDSNPGQAADWYATFESSILGYANGWVTERYALATKWHYFGPQFGNKAIGMNVKYATDPYWSEKMAANYYDLDRSKGLQDYDYYQLGVITNWATQSYSAPSTSSKQVYKYPEPEDAVVIVSEVTGDTVNGNNKWYEVVADMNLDNNYNKRTGDYNWNKTVFVPATYIKKINNGKNGYISPNSVTEYKDSKYSYDLLSEGAVFKPKVALTTKDTEFYYDSALDNKKGQVLKKSRYVMIYNIAYDENKNVVSYQVSSDHKKGQRHWVPADSIQIVNKAYGRSYVQVSGNQFTWVNSTTEDTKETLISGFYDDVYFPILEEKTVSGQKWYKVPVDISGTTNIYGWTLAHASSNPKVEIELFGTINNGNFPVIKAENASIVQGTNFDIYKGVTATDVEDGNITNSIKIKENNLDINKVGQYTITYEVTDSTDLTTTKSITITVTENHKPEIIAEDIEIIQGHELKEKVSATDTEDGDLTKSIQTIKNDVNTNVPGTYEITYQVTDSYNQTTTKTIKVTVLKDEAPTINAEDRTIEIDDIFKEMYRVTAIDKEDGDITEKVVVIKNEVDSSKEGIYEVTYEVEDSFKNKTTKTIRIEVVKEKELKEVNGTFFLNYLKESNGVINIQGYQTILGIDNNLNINIKYQLIFENINNGEKTTFKATRLTDNIPKKVYSPDGKDYTYSWFDAKVDVDKLDLGNYKMYIVAKSDSELSKTLIVNKTFNKQATYTKSSVNNAIISNNYSSANSFVEVKIRKEVLCEKSSSYIYNQYDKYTKFEFTEDKKLHLRGNSYSYGMDLASSKKVERKIIFENQENYKIYTKNLGSITNGNYTVVLPEKDNLDKTRAWYDNNIDISDIPEGNYTIYITTKSNLNDIAEFSEKIGRNLDDVSETINNKKYSFTINKNRGSRIEMKVTK